MIQLKPMLRRGWLRYALAGAGLLLAILIWYRAAGQPVTIIIEGQSRQVRSHQASVAAALAQLDLPLVPQDIITPTLDSPLDPAQVITVDLAQPVNITLDGGVVETFTHQTTLAAVLAEAGVVVTPHDRIEVNGLERPLQSSLVAALPADFAPANVASAGLSRLANRATLRPQPWRIEIQRAVAITLHENGGHAAFYTTRPTVGQALAAHGITLYPEDELMPAADTALFAGMNIFLQRSTPVTVMVDGQSLAVRTRQFTAGGALAAAGIPLMGQDYTVPALHQPLAAHDIVQVVRVRELLHVDEEFIPFETTWLPDESMDLDRQEVRQPGATGVLKTRTRVRLENGQEVARQVEDEWLDQEQRPREVAYGTKITVRTLDTEAGPVEYWRKLSMLQTPYSAATAGKDPDHPRYGITRSGLPAGFGKVAVDPKVIPLMTNLYIPGYGPALAADTGGLILGKHIDLGFDEGQAMPSLYKWGEVYVLTPVPPADKIRYVLPNWPQR